MTAEPQRNVPKRVKRANYQRDMALSALAQLEEPALLELERRAGAALRANEDGAGTSLHDGYPTSLRLGPGGRGRATRHCVEGGCFDVAAPGRTRCGDHSTDEAERDDQLPPPPQSDPVGELVVAGLVDVDPTPGLVAECFAELERGAALIRSAAARMVRIRQNPLAGRQSSIGHCMACERSVLGTPDDRLRSGFCDACRKAWERAGLGDRAAFIRDRRAELHKRAS
jgi:hypothetical protein